MIIFLGRFYPFSFYLCFCRKRLVRLHPCIRFCDCLYSCISVFVIVCICICQEGKKLCAAAIFASFEGKLRRKLSRLNGPSSLCLHIHHIIIIFVIFILVVIIIAVVVIIIIIFVVPYPATELVMKPILAFFLAEGTLYFPPPVGPTQKPTFRAPPLLKSKIPKTYHFFPTKRHSKSNEL